MRHVVRRSTCADLEFEDAVTADFEHALGLFDVLGRIAARQRPREWQAVVQLAAQQLISGHVERARNRVDRCHFHGALGKTVALADRIHLLDELLETRRVLALHGRCEVVVDRVQDAFGRFFVPRWATNRRRLAKTAGPIGEPQLHDHRTLARDRAKRELVRADRGNVQNARLNALDAQTGCSGRIHGGWGCGHGVQKIGVFR